jgi:nicotinamide riboside kinase
MTHRSKPLDIYIVGAQCTGKTTLVRALEDYFNKRNNSYKCDGHPISRPKIITEVARHVLQDHHFTADDIKSSPTRALALQQLILPAQLSAERAVSEEEWFISDRSGIDPIIYARKYAGMDAETDLIKSPEWLELRRRMRTSMVIVCEAGVGWLVDDGTRLMPESREDWINFHQLFCNRLDDFGLAYEVLPCDVTDLAERVAFVLKKWEVLQQTDMHEIDCGSSA